MVASLLSVVLAASPISVAAAGFSPVGGVSEDTASFIAEHFANLLATQPQLEVTTQRAVMALLGLERQRQLMGCAADSSRTCLAELTGALGAKVLLVGEVAKLEHSLQVNLRLIEASSGHVLHLASVRGESSEVVLDRLEPVAIAAGRALRAHYGLESTSGPRWPSLVLTGAGVLAAGVGTYFLVDAANAWARLGTPSLDLAPTDAKAVASSGARSQWLGVGLTAAGAVAVISGLIWFAVTGDSHVSMAITPTSAGLMVRWGLP
jgi:TolB-like protein